MLLARRIPRVGHDGERLVQRIVIQVDVRAMLGLDAETTGHATQGHGGFFRRASDFQEAGLTGIG